MTPAELHTKLVNESPILPGGQPYGVTAFGGDILENKLCRETSFTMHQYLPTGQKLRIIEIGTGGGRWTRHLAHYADTIMCIDPARRMPDHVGALNLPCTIIPFVHKFWSLPTHPGSPIHETFDLAFTFDTYVHANAREIRTSMLGLRDALKPGGLLVAHYATLERKTDNQPHDQSGMWITHWPYWFNTQLNDFSFELLETVYANEGFGSVVAIARKRGA
jgi:SAM-dependent methyltransferase